MRFMQKLLTATVILTCLLTGWAAADGPAKSAGPVIDGEARRLLGEMRQSEYSHKTSVDESQGVFKCDCSGFVDLVLKKVAPRLLSEIETRRAKGKRQLAEDYVAAFVEAPATEAGPWQHVVRVADARPGDILCWNNPKHKEGDHLNTGHVMIIDQEPVAETHKGQKLYRIVVIDSTATAHSDDSRKDGATGLGRGTLFLSVDSDGKPIGYHWKSAAGQLHEVTVAIGRGLVQP